MVFFQEIGLKKGFRKTSLALKEVFRKPKSTFLTFEKIKVGSRTFEKLKVFPWNLKFFLKSTRPSLPLKKAPPLFPSPFPLRGQGMCQPPFQ